MFFDSADFTRRMTDKGQKGIPFERLTKPPLTLRAFEEFAVDELIAMPTGAPMIYDVECYPNYFIVSFKCPKSGKVICFERSPDKNFDGEVLRWMMFKFCTIGFFSDTYDMPMVYAACKGFDCELLKRLSDDLIGNKSEGIPGMRPREVSDAYNFEIPFERTNHIDLKEVAPLDGGLKLYGARMHHPHMQDLPYKPATVLTREEALVVKHYNINDLDLTIALYNELKGEIELRETLSKEYNTDLRSRSDAQIAEAVITSEITKITGKYPKKNTKEITSVKYEAPKWVGFVSPELRDIVNRIEAAEFKLDATGKPVWPEGLGEPEKNKAGETVWVLKTSIGGMLYKMGMGGLHSTEKCAKHEADDDTLIIDRDVASFYPRIILNEGLFPKHLGKVFLKVYDALVTKRLSAKAAGIKKIANALKITINGGFGKFGNKYSRLYSPDLLLKVTITGQLALMMLIEMITHHGIPVVSGNTDGIIIKCPKNRYDELNEIIALWESITRFETEETQYKAIYSRDVNNYIAVKLAQDEKGKFIEGKIDFKPDARYFADRMGCKTKGTYSELGSALNSVLSANPESLICSDAVLRHIVEGKPIRETIMECDDIRRFATVRQVNGGAQKNGEFIGKVIRWYLAENNPGPIEYIGSGKKVGKSEGAKPLMDLPPQMPDDVNYERYVEIGRKILEDIGFAPKVQETLFF